MEHWAAILQVGGIIFFAGVSLGTLNYIYKEVSKLTGKIDLLDRRENYRHQHTLIVLTQLAAYHNPDNHHLSAAIQKLASNHFTEE